MSEFNPEQPHGYRERVKSKTPNRRELLGVGNKSSDLPEKPRPAEKPQKGKTRIGQFLDKPITRRDLLKLGGAAGAAYLLKDLTSSLENVPDRYKTPEKVQDAIKYLEEVDLQLPQDQLYGFTFPSIREMAKRYRETLNAKIEGSPFDSSLVVIQEKKPRTMIQAIIGIIPPLRKIFGTSEAPSVSKGEPHFLYLPPYVADYSVVEMAGTLYHEGLHLFYQGELGGSKQDVFNREIMPNIADIFFDRAMLERGEDLKRYYTKDVDAYDQAVRENNRQVWEKHLKELYKLPENCCTYQPPLPQKP